MQITLQIRVFTTFFLHFGRSKTINYKTCKRSTEKINWSPMTLVAINIQDFQKKEGRYSK